MMYSSEDCESSWNTTQHDPVMSHSHSLLYLIHTPRLTTGWTWRKCVLIRWRMFSEQDDSCEGCEDSHHDLWTTHASFFLRSVVDLWFLQHSVHTLFFEQKTAPSPVKFGYYRQILFFVIGLFINQSNLWKSIITPLSHRNGSLKLKSPSSFTVLSSPWRTQDDLRSDWRMIFWAVADETLTDGFNKILKLLISNNLPWLIESD